MGTTIAPGAVLGTGQAINLGSSQFVGGPVVPESCPCPFPQGFCAFPQGYCPPPQPPCELNAQPMRPSSLLQSSGILRIKARVRL